MSQWVSCMLPPKTREYCTSFFLNYFYFHFYFIFCFLGLHQWYMEVPRLVVESELQLLACATATAIRDLSHVCDLHHSSRQHRILNPLSKARDRTQILMDTGWVHYCWAMMRTADFYFYFYFFILVLHCQVIDIFCSFIFPLARLLRVEFPVLAHAWKYLFSQNAKTKLAGLTLNVMFW